MNDPHDEVHESEWYEDPDQFDPDELGRYVIQLLAGIVLGLLLALAIGVILING